MNYSEALEKLKEGKLMARTNWNAKNMFVFLVPGSTFIVDRKPLLDVFPEGTVFNYNSHIGIENAAGNIVPWFASQDDMLAEDWEEIIVTNGTTAIYD